MIRASIISFILIAVIVTPGISTQTPDRSGQSQPRATELIPTVYYDSLLNGLQILIVERSEQPEVTVGFMIKSGAAFDLAGREGTADLTARMVLRGSHKVNDKSLAQQFQELGVDADLSVTWDATRFTFQFPPRYLAQILPLLAQILSRPTFPESDLVALKQQRLDELRHRRLSPSALTAMALSRLVFERHPYARSVEGEIESIEKITPVDIARYHRRFYLANDAMLTVVGNVSAQAVMPLIRPTFGALRKGDVVPATFAAPTKPHGIHIKVIDHPDQDDATIGMGYLTVARASDDFTPLLLLNYALGGASASQLARLASVFSSEGVTLTSHLDARALAGSFSILATARSHFAPAIVSTLLRFIESTRTEGLTQSELITAKRHFIENFPAQLRTNRHIVEQLQDIELYGLGRDYILSYDQRIDRMTLEQVNKVAADYLSTTNVYIVIAGPAAEIVEKLKTMGTVEVVKP